MSTKGSNKIMSQRKGKNNITNSSVIQNSNTKPARKEGVTRTCGFIQCKKSKIFPVRFLKQLGVKVAKSLHGVSMRIRPPSPKVSSSSVTSKPFVTPVDTHRNAAIEDCIEFINSSASLPRSNSVPANSH